MVYFDKILYAYVFYHFPATGMQNVDKTSLSIILVSQAFLVKMLITLEPHGIFGLNFVYSCIYAPNFEKVDGAYCFWSVGAWVRGCSGHTFCTYCNF